MTSILLIGASGGIGHCVAEELLKKGYAVIGTYFKHPKRVGDLMKRGHFKGLYVDVQSVNSVKKLQTLLGNSHDLFAVVNCSGIVEFEGKSDDEDFEIWNRVMDTNLSGNYYLAKIFGKDLSENGRFIMMSSTDSYFGGAITTSYAASKSGVNSLVKSLSLLFQDKKIRVNAIAPGWVTTPMSLLSGREFLEKVAAINPLKRNAEPVDVANLVAFLLSDESEYINGQIISLEGGYTNQDPTLLLEQKIQS